MWFLNNIVLPLKCIFLYMSIFKIFQRPYFVLCHSHSQILTKMTFTSNVIQNFSKTRSKHVKLVADRKLDVPGIRIL